VSSYVLVVALLTGHTRLGILMNVLHGANLVALWKSCNFILGVGSASKAQPAKTPRILRNAVAILLFYLSLAYACAICESWLSATSKAIPFPQETAYKGSLPLFKRQLNQTRCNSFSAPDQSQSYSDLCGLISGVCVTSHI
jgi:hypothetical protein